MRIDEHGIGYSWEDLRPIHRLMYVIFGTQLLGALVGLGLRGESDWFDAAWRGAALATLPGFGLGFLYQAATAIAGIRQNKVMVAFCGGFSALFTLLGWMLLPPQ